MAKAHAEAERNLSALKVQSRGLESEYDRLLAENDELKRRGRADGAAGKKDE